jgi:hypothetical protein
VLCRESPQVEGDGQDAPKSTLEPQVEWPLVAPVHLAGSLPLASAEAPCRLGRLVNSPHMLVAKKGGTTNAPSSFRILSRSGGVFIPIEEVHDD